MVDDWWCRSLLQKCTTESCVWKQTICEANVASTLLEFALTNITLIFAENYDIILSEDSAVVAFNQLASTVYMNNDFSPRMCVHNCT